MSTLLRWDEHMNLTNYYAHGLGLNKSHFDTLNKLNARIKLKSRD